MESNALTAPSEEQLQQLHYNDMVFGVEFARVVSVLMQSAHYKYFTLSDLEWLVVPALLTGQFAVLDATVENVALPVPVAVALWAFVSPEVDHRLSTNLAVQVRLRPDEWNSGDIPWLIDIVGDARAIPLLKTELLAGPFKKLKVKVRIERDGRTRVEALQVNDTNA